MKVLEGHSTVPPRTPANSSAVSAAPDQLLMATDGSPFQRSQDDSNDSTSAPCAQRWDVITSSHIACTRARSRWSKPIANVLRSGAP